MIYGWENSWEYYGDFSVSIFFEFAVFAVEYLMELFSLELELINIRWSFSFMRDDLIILGGTEVLFGKCFQGRE